MPLNSIKKNKLRKFLGVPEVLEVPKVETVKTYVKVSDTKEVKALKKKLDSLEKAFQTKETPPDLDKLRQEFEIKINSLVIPDEATYLKEVETLKEKLKTYTLDTQHRGGSMNRKLSINSSVLSKRYTDVNFKGSGVTYVAVDNNTTKEVDLTLTAAGGGGGGVSSVVAGTGIVVDNSTPTTPIVILGNTSVTAGTYGSGTQVGQFTVNAQGRITAASVIGITPSGGGMAIGGAITNSSVGSALYVGAASVLAQDNSNFFFDSTNKYLGVGIGVPLAPLHVKNTIGTFDNIKLDTTGTGGNQQVDINLGSTNAKGIRIYASTSPLSSSPDGAGFQFYSTSSNNFPGQVYFDSGADNSAAIVFRTTGTGGTITERYRIDSSGNSIFNGDLRLVTQIKIYNNVSTAGWGVPAIYGSGRSTAQTAAVATVATYTVGAADGSFQISSNVNITTSTAHSFTVTCAYTDETNTARTLTLSFIQIGGGTPIATITNVTGVGPYEGVPNHIRCKASTAITIATTGTFTTVTYNVEAIITQLM